jgi:hypothetical protein
MSKGKKGLLHFSSKCEFLSRASLLDERRDPTIKISKIKMKRTAQQVLNNLRDGLMKNLDNRTGLNYRIATKFDLSFPPGQLG